MTGIILKSVLTSPVCGHVKTETMPTDACQVVLRMRRLPYPTEAEARRLLRFMFLWNSTLSADSGAW